MDIFTTAIYL
uniref:Uncharacterized protein n=1 Tax=Anguilla anguilla TaxID=7936 RepID=A0A0E9XW57_ANGAN